MMSGAFTRTKRVTDPLDDKVKARIVGRETLQPCYASSGSEHSAQIEDDVASPSFSELFFESDENHGGGESSSESNDSDSDCDPSMYDPNNVNVDSVRRILQDQRDEFQKMLGVYVSKAMQIFSGLISKKQLLRREVMAFLRNCGYNAAICKTKWESSGGLTAGNYEFIDVVWTKYSVRYIVDLDFASEFQIARPSNGYERLLQYIPTIFVGKSDDLKQILKTTSDAARRSMKSRSLLLPPWRKNRFMQNKWLGPYRRTTNPYPSSFSSPLPDYNATVKCRAVGFDATVEFNVTCHRPYKIEY